MEQIVNSTPNQTPDATQSASMKHPRLLESPYGYVSFRQLTVMKIVDRTSLYIMGLAPEFANVAVITSYSWFGAFGSIEQIRIIQSKKNEVYIRFLHEESAINALLWVNNDLASSIGASAKHGYQKYCTKFLQRKKCNRAKCQLLHEWKDFKEVLNQDKVQQLNPLNRTPGLKPIFPERTQPAPNANPSSDQMDRSPSPPVKDSSSSSSSSSGPSMFGNILLVQKQINEMQRTFDESKEVLANLLEDVALLEHENGLLRHENAQHAKRLGNPLPDHLVELDHDVDSIVDELLSEMSLNMNISANSSDTGSPDLSDCYDLSDSMTASTWERKYAPLPSV